MGSGHIVGVSSLAGRVWTPYRWEVAILWVCRHWLGGCGHHTIQMGSGHIVGVSSLAGRVWTPYSSSYAAAKSAFCALLEAVRMEVSQ